MDITSIAVEAGFTMQAGDYQSVKATIAMKAELARGEDADAATAELKKRIMSHLIDTAAQAHPDAARKLMAGVKPQTAIAAPKTETPAAPPADAAKRTRRTKEQIAADEAAAKSKSSKPDTGLLADTEEGLGIGGLDKEAELGGGLEDSSLADDGLGAGGPGSEDDLLGDGLGEEKVEVTIELLREKMREASKTKGPAILSTLFRKIGVADLRSTPTTKYEELYALANKAIHS